MSHSWHDDPQSKWRELQSWSSEFAAMKNREPRIWFDKFCIDQSNIEEDLKSLPIFISGCKRMLVLCGPTYLSRLWCVLEIFTFVHMGGMADRLVLVPVL